MVINSESQNRLNTSKLLWNRFYESSLGGLSSETIFYVNPTSPHDLKSLLWLKNYIFFSKKSVLKTPRVDLGKSTDKPLWKIVFRILGVPTLGVPHRQSFESCHVIWIPFKNYEICHKFWKNGSMILGVLTP